jgi:hypothetical protein
MKPFWPFWHRNPTLSVIVPFRDDGEFRTAAWEWLERFWMHHLPERGHDWLSVEIVMGSDDEWPFSKAIAVNNAAQVARGKVLAIMDADCYMDPAVIQTVALNLVESIEDGRRDWYIPFNKLYRLSRRASEEVMDRDPHADFKDPALGPGSIDNDGAEGYGHQFGALCLMMPREAFWEVGGMDPRFRGWGGEDSSFMKSLDTLWGLHQITDNNAYHLWHDRPGENFETRRWVGQVTTNVNIRLAQRYNRANFDQSMMRQLIRERGL